MPTVRARRSSEVALRGTGPPSAASPPEVTGVTLRMRALRLELAKSPGPWCRRLAESYASGDRWSPVRRRTCRRLAACDRPVCPPGDFDHHPTRGEAPGIRRFEPKLRIPYRPAVKTPAS